jgi:SagB-type dehydrogenase family enzyme
VSRRGFLALTLGAAGGLFVGRGFRQPPPIPQGSDLGVVYHEWSKPGVMDVFGTVADWGQQPPLYKTYEQAPQVALPTPRLDGGLPTEEAINRRRSTREYSGEPMTLEELSRVLFLMGGINGERWGNRLRTAPSSGALYPIEVYAVAHGITGLEPGVYHYGVKDHSLARVRSGDLREEVVRQGLSQQFLGECNAVLFLTVIFQRMRFKYQDRTYRYGLIEAGHLGQNIYLAATSMGLGVCAIGAFMDNEINKMLGVDGEEEAAVYMLGVGKV